MNEVAGSEVVRRSMVQGSAEAYSGASIERVQLRDGRTFVLKHLPAEGDWLTRVSGRPDRMRQLWDDGVLARVGSVVDHAVVDVVESDGHDVVVMRDVSDELAAVDRSSSRSLLAGLAALHEVGEGIEAVALCGIDARYRMFAPAAHAPTVLPGPHPRAAQLVAGWAHFGEVAPTRVADVVFAVHDGSIRLSEHLADRPATLLHGDAKRANLGLGSAGRLVAIDWGDLTGFGPAEVDVGWFALMNEEPLGATPEETFDMYDAVASRPLDPAAVDVVCIGSLAQMGCKIAVTDRLAPWCRRVEDALDRSGLG